MKYRRILRTPTYANKERCRVLRSLWAQKFFNILEKDFKVICIDESTFGESDYRR